MKLERKNRNGETEAYTVTPDDAGNKYLIEGPRGQHTVEYCGSGDADPDYVAIWSCTCLSRKTCKHIDMVSEYISLDETHP